MRKKRLMAMMLSMAMLLTGCTTEAVVEEEIEPPKKEEPVPVTDISAVDDFYGYVNLKRLDELKIGYGASSVGSFDETSDILEDEIDELLDDILKSDKTYPKGSNEQIIHDYYYLYLNEEEPSEDAEEFFDGLFRKVDDVSDVEEYGELMAELYREYDIKLFFDFDVRMDILNPDSYASVFYPSSEIYMGNTLKSLVEYRSTSCARFAESVLKSQGVSKEDAERRAKDIMFMFIDIAKASDFDLYEDILNFNKYIDEVTFDELDNIFSAIDFRKYFEICGAEIPKKIYIGNKEAVEVLNAQLTEENLQALKDYAKCKIVAGYGEYLPDKYKDLRGAYFPKMFSLKEKEARETVKGTFMERISEIYADKYMSVDVIEKATEMCEDMRESYSKLINSADWLSAEGRKLINKKLDNMVFMIGGKKSEKPDPANDIIGKDMLETSLKMSKKFVDDNIANINKPYDRYEFGMPSCIVNACYDTPNTVTVPYGILHKPFFDADAPESVNLGAIGAVIAHEMSHAFDSNCIKFDMNGNYNPDWIPKEDVLAFEEKMKQVEEYYNDFTIMDVYHVDGELTLGENFADLGGVECVMSVVKTDKEKKELMESYANIWCTLMVRKDAIEYLHLDEHSPDMIRVNAVLSSCDDFYRIYGVKEGDGMYIPPEKRVSRW